MFENPNMYFRFSKDKFSTAQAKLLLFLIDHQDWTIIDYMSIAVIG